MKKLLLIAALASLPITACAPSKPVAPKHAKFHRAKHKVYTFADGRRGYQDDAGIWWWLIVTQQQQASSASISVPIRSAGSTGSSSLYTGGWTRGAAPSGTQLSSAKAEEAEVVEDEAGEPVDEAEAQEAASEGVESLPDEATAEAEAQAEASESGGEAAESGDTGSSDAGSSDAGSSDGGGGDSGGGGDGGGGGGE